VSSNYCSFGNTVVIGIIPVGKPVIVQMFEYSDICIILSESQSLGAQCGENGLIIAVIPYSYLIYEILLTQSSLYFANLFRFDGI
jgi:hypothetical protein